MPYATTRAREHRPVTIDQIRRVGCGLGLDRLSMNAVASELGVTTTALYRHVDGRWELEQLVGESLLADLVLHDDPSHDVLRHLVSFARQLRTFTLARPGLAGYLQTLFPRGESGTRLLAEEVHALTRRGYDRAAGMVLSGAVASLAISLCVTEELRHGPGDVQPEGSVARGGASETRFVRDPRFATAARTLPSVGIGEYLDLLIGASVHGMVEVAPPGRPVAEVVSALREMVV